MFGTGKASSECSLIGRDPFQRRVSGMSFKRLESRLASVGGISPRVGVSRDHWESLTDTYFSVG